MSLDLASSQALLVDAVELDYLEVSVPGHRLVHLAVPQPLPHWPVVHLVHSVQPRHSLLQVAAGVHDVLQAAAGILPRSRS